MKRLVKLAMGALACCTVVGWSMSVDAADTRSATSNTTVMTHRASKIIGLNVRNAQGERLGTVDDLVLDMNTGKISYFALGFGGVLGLGEKLFAVPVAAMKMEHGTNENYFVLHVDKEMLKAAPGFDKNHWPDFADPNWSKHVDEYYRAASAIAPPKDVKTSERKK